MTSRPPRRSRVLRALKRSARALVVLLLMIIPVPIAALFARGERGPRRNPAGQVVRREEDG